MEQWDVIEMTFIFQKLLLKSTGSYECKPVRKGTELNWKLNFTPMKHRESVIRTHTHRGGLFNGSIMSAVVVVKNK